MIPISAAMTALGLGLGASGAIYLSFGLLRTPTGIASELFGQAEADRMYPKGGHGSVLLVSELARATVCGRYGLACLLGSCVLQLSALLVPNGAASPVCVTGLAIGAVWASGWYGKRWTRRAAPEFESAIWGAPRITVVADLEALKAQARGNRTWREPRALAALQRIFL